MTEPEVRNAPLGAIDVPWNVVVPEVAIHIAGYGNRLPNDFTLELLAVLARCKRVFGAPPIAATRFGIPAMEDLDALCDSDDPQAAAEIVLAAAAADPPVALATPGSALVGAPTALRIVELAGERGLALHVTNAVPSFDAIWADFNIEPFYGCEIWDAATFVARGIEPGIRAHLLLARAPVNDPVALTVLRDHLLRHYVPEHEVHVTATAPGAGPHVLATGSTTLALRDLAGCRGERRSTLVVARASRQSFDFEARTLTDASSR